MDLSMMPPGLAGFLQGQEQAQQGTAQNLQMAGVMQTLAANAQKQQRDQAFRSELQALGPNPTDEQLSAVAGKYGGPDVLLKTKEAAIAKKQQQELVAQQYADRLKGQQDALEEKKRQFDAKAASDADKVAFQQQYQTEKANNDRMMQGLMLQLKQAGIQLQSDKTEGSRKDALQKQTQQLGTALERAGLNEGHAVLTDVENALKKSPKLAEYISGPLSGTPDIAIGALTPDMTKEEAEGIRTGRQAFNKLFNITLKTRSGAAVTNQELERLKQEFAAGSFKTADQLKNAVEKARGIISSHYRGIASGFGPEVMNAYNENLRELGGTPLLEPIGTPTTPASGQIKRLKFDAQGNPVP